MRVESTPQSCDERQGASDVSTQRANTAQFAVIAPITKQEKKAGTYRLPAEADVLPRENVQHAISSNPTSIRLEAS